ncbi:hypothetical protein EDC01DRAFT_792081 [Geopyxis carbonaria]|nr:hypothetical protein EDC01DRAFT_792081 [Geopyxis carbonaria]
MDVPSHRNDEARAAAVFEMPTGSPTEDEEKAPDFRELRLRATEALARIRAHGYSYDRSCLESYEAREMEIYKTESTGSKRDRRLFDAYVQTVLRPVYTALSEDAKTLVKDEAAELFRYTKPNSKHKRKISIITFPGSGWDEEVSPVESLSKGHRFSRSRTDSSYITRTSNSRVTTFGSDVTVATNFTLPEDSELPSTPFIRQPREWPKTEADADSDTGPEKLPESLQEAAEELNPPKTPQQDIPLGFTSGPIDWGDDPTLFGPPEEHPPVVEEPKNLGATLEGPESLLADYEEIAFLEQSRLHTLEASSEEEIELPLYRTRMDFTGANSGEITLTTGNLVAVSAIENGSSSGSEDIPENMATANNIRFADADTEKRAYEPLTFVIESWLMVDLTGFCGLFDHHDHPLLSAPIEVALDPMLPPLIDPATLEHTTKQLLVPAEMSATMLHDWKCLHFTWTPNTAEHLSYTQSTGQVKLYGHVSYCFLHALAGSDSSLLKRGFTRHHAALLEIAHTYRLLFGADPESRVLFSELDVKNRLAGYFDIFDELPPADTQPRLHYLLAKDFPIYGERLLALRLLLKPTGLRSLWKDKRDSLQWYTFWAVVFLGVLGIGVGVVQVALGAVQAYASMAALRQSQHGRRSYPPLTAQPRRRHDRRPDYSILHYRLETEAPPRRRHDHRPDYSILHYYLETEAAPV